MTTTTPSTLLGPLTTTYTPTGSICNSIHFADNPVGTGWFAYGGIASDSTSCMPTGFTRDPQYYFSPAACPSGYTVACQSSISTDGTTTTVGTCCPMNYVCRTPRAGNIYGCTSLVTAETVLTIESVTYETISSESTTVYAQSSDIITTTLSSDQTWIEAYGVIVQRQSGDAPFIATSTSTTSSGATATGSSSQTGSSAQGTSSSEAASSLGLSTGAKVGIGIGVAAGVLLFLLTALLFIWKRKTRNNANNNNNFDPAGHPDMQYTSNVQWSRPPPGFSEVGDNHSHDQIYADQTYMASPDGGVAKGSYTPLQELSAHKAPAEMPQYTRIHEMHADQINH